MSFNCFGNPEIKQWARFTLPNIPIPSLDERRRTAELIEGKKMILREIEIEIAKDYFTIAPIRALPREVLGLIFEFWTQTPLSDDEECYRSNYLHVCSRWREVALSHPRCWTYVAGRCDYGGKREAVLLERLSLAAQCSKGLPLHFSVVLDYPNEPHSSYSGPTVKRITRILRDHSSILRSYEERSSSRFAELFRHLIHDLNPHSLNGLTHLGIIDSGLSLHTTERWQLPNLKHLRIFQPEILHFEYILAPNLLSIALIDSRAYPGSRTRFVLFDRLAAGLGSFSMLQEVVIFGIPISHRIDASIHRLESVRTVTLGIPKHYRLNMKIIIQAFPHVRALNISGNNIHNCPEPQELHHIRSISIAPFFRQSGCRKGDDEEFAKLLASASMLENLELSTHRFTRNFEIGSSWPLLLDKDSMLEFGNPDLQSAFFMTLGEKLKELGHSINPHYLQHLQYLRLDFLEIDRESLSVYLRNFAEEGEGKPCLISSRNCCWHSESDCECNSGSVPDTSDLEWYKFLDLAFSNPRQMRYGARKSGEHLILL